jgi:hypothetical protein
MLRRLAVFGASASMVIGALAMTAGPASAATIGTCNTVKGSATITPGLTFTAHAQTVKSSGTLSACTGGETHGSFTSTLKGTTKCADTAGKVALTGTETIKWGSGKTTQASAKVKSTSDPTKVQLIGVITSGEFFKAGKTTKMSVTIQFTPTQGNCTTPVTKVTFKNTTPATISR